MCVYTYIYICIEDICKLLKRLSPSSKKLVLPGHVLVPVRLLVVACSREPQRELQKRARAAADDCPLAPVLCICSAKTAPSAECERRLWEDSSSRRYRTLYRLTLTVLHRFGGSSLASPGTLDLLWLLGLRLHITVTNSECSSDIPGDVQSRI